MTKNNNYENLHLYSNINLILPERYPTDYPLHWHQFIEIMALPYDAKLSVLPIIKLDRTEYTLHPGDIILAWPGELHEIRNNLDHQLIALQFPGHIISEQQDFIPYINTFRTIHKICGQTQSVLSQNIISSMKHMLVLKQSNQPFCGIETLICLFELFVTFSTYIQEHYDTYAIKGLSYSNQTLSKMNQACTYINENCQQPLSLDDVANQFGFSTYYFSRMFKSATNFSFTEYLTLQRVKRAQVYLAESDSNITEIAFLSGFKSISSFNRAFRQFRGCSPRDYRKYHATDSIDPI